MGTIEGAVRLIIYQWNQGAIVLTAIIIRTYCCGCVTIFSPIFYFRVRHLIMLPVHLLNQFIGFGFKLAFQAVLTILNAQYQVSSTP